MNNQIQSEWGGIELIFFLNSTPTLTELTRTIL